LESAFRTNDDDDAEADGVLPASGSGLCARYAIFQCEQCPSTGRRHWQGYVEFRGTKRLAAVKAFFADESVHCEPRRGSRDEAREYCRKSETAVDGTRREFGVWVTKKGERSDLESLRETLDSGATVLEVSKLHFGSFVRFQRGINEYVRVREREQRRGMRLGLVVTVYWGSTGAGKTRRVFAEHGTDLYKLDVGNNVWWDGYAGEDVLLMDDFYGWLKFGFLLNVLDVYPLRLEVKGGFTYANWTKVFITSNKHPDDWYKDLNHEQAAALARRIHKIEHFTTGT